MDDSIDVTVRSERSDRVGVVAVPREWAPRTEGASALVLIPLEHPGFPFVPNTLIRFTDQVEAGDGFLVGSSMEREGSRSVRTEVWVSEARGVGLVQARTTVKEEGEVLEVVSSVPQPLWTRLSTVIEEIHASAKVAVAEVEGERL